MPTSSTQPGSSFLANHVDEYDPLSYATQLQWSVTQTQTGYGTNRTNGYVHEVTPKPTTGDLGLGEIGRAPDEALDLMSRLLTQRQTTASENAPAPQAKMRVDFVWEGVVTKVGSEFFEAKFVPLGRGEPVFRGEFLRGEVPEDDQELVRRNALFYVIAGKIQISKHHWQPTSALRFRRIPRVTEARLEQAIRTAQSLLPDNAAE